MSKNTQFKLALLLFSLVSMQVGVQANPDDTNVDSFWSEVRLGKKYARQNKIESAIECYRKAATMANSGLQFVHLIWRWEDILEKRPFDPSVHIALASAFLRAQNPRLWDAEVHCKRAIYLSPEHSNHEAENLLQVIESKKATTTNRSMQTTKIEQKAHKFKDELARRWKPPDTSGFNLVRFRVVVDRNANVKELRCRCPSGVTQFDQSALRVLKNAPFGKLTGLQVPGLFDFAFVVDGKEKMIDYSSDGGVVVP